MSSASRGPKINFLTTFQQRALRALYRRPDPTTPERAWPSPWAQGATRLASRPSRRGGRAADGRGGRR
eukprot:1710718-Prymnesium_polylepis.1